MITFLVILLCLSAFIIFFAMIGYPLLLKIIDKVIKPAENKKDSSYEPTVSFLIVAHNEEAVIESKLKNAISLDYPKDKFQIIVASDNSTDSTNTIVNKFISNHPEHSVVLYCSKEHKGKTNAQNEAQKIATGEVLVMTDANTMIRNDAIKELISYFSSEEIVYVCGKLEYSNSSDNLTSKSESTYWDIDLSMRDIESRLRTITAGNGALYACRNKDYIDFNPISCHDSIMPFTYSKQGKRALFNPDAVAVEKAGETDLDEYKRKVRMNRDLFDMLRWGFSVLNVFKYGWFSFFYFGHRTCRYLLWFAHLIFFVSTIGLGICGCALGWILSGLQIVCFALAAFSLKTKSRNVFLHMTGYYGMTILAQFHAVYNILSGKTKPVWEKAESTR